jgi:putative aldouronate transport system substrate-binding protein
MKMSKLLKQGIALLTTAMIIAIVFAACGKKTVTPQSGTGEAQAWSGSFNVNNSPGEEPYAPMAEKVVMTIGKLEAGRISYEPGESVDDNWVLRFHEDALNIDYQNAWSVLSQEAYDQRVSLTMAMGNMPDAMVVNQLQLRQMVDAGLVADLTEAMEKYASVELRKSFASTNGFAIESSTFDGKVMALPGVIPGSSNGVSLLFIRADWMKKYGLEEPKTMDDVIHIADVFRKNEGMGLVVGNRIVQTENSYFGLDAIFGLFGSYPKIWITDKNGELTYGSLTPETKEALAFLNKLVRDGVIDKNFVVLDTDQCIELVTGGKAGIFYGPWWYLNWPLLSMSKADGNIMWNCYTAPLTDAGIYNVSMPVPTMYYAVARKGYEHLDAFVKTLNLSYMTGQFRTPMDSHRPNAQANYLWDMAPITLLQCEYDEKEAKARNAVNAFNGIKPVEELGPEEREWFDHYSYVVEHGLQKALEDTMAGGWAYATSGYVLAKADDTGILNRVFAATYTKTESMSTRWATLEKLEDEIFLQIIAGERELDAFDSFVAQWRSLGGDLITEELKELEK